MAQINWAAEAERWLRNIYDYIAGDNPEAAEQTVLSLVERVEILRSFPKAGYLYQKIPGKPIRILHHGHYRIAYLLKSENHIDILGVFHEKLAIERYLNL